MSREIRLIPLLALAATLLSLTPATLAAPPSTSAHRVEVSAAGCDQPAVDFERVVELLRVELSSFDVEVLASPGPTSLAAAAQKETGPARTSRVTLTVGAEPTDPREPCQAGATEVTVRVEQEGFAGPAARRRVEISDVAATNRARTLAIAAAELLQVTWSSSSTSPGNAVSVQTAAPAPPLKAADAKAPPSRKPPPIRRSPTLEFNPGVWIEAGVLARAFPSGSTALLGPELSLSVPLVSVLTLTLSGEVSGGVASLPFDDANGSAGTISASTATFSFGPALRSRGPIALEIGPRFGLGDSRLTSRFHERAANKALVFVSFDASVRAQLLAGWAGFAGIEVGRGLTGALLETGDSVSTFRSVELNGVLIGARIGMSFALTQRP